MVALRALRGRGPSGDVAMGAWMPHLLFYAAAAGVATLGYRAFKRAADKVHQRHAEQLREEETGAKGTLQRDPETGRYRVRAD